MRKTTDDPLLDIFSRPAAVTKSERIQGRRHKRGICRDQVETFAAQGLEEIADHNLQIGRARDLGVEARAAGRARIDIDSEHLLGVRGSE